MSTSHSNTDTSQLFIRPARMEDLSRLFEISTKVGPGFTSLPENEKKIEEKITLSLLSFAGNIEIPKRLFMFVLEDQKTHRVMATSALESRVDGHSPFFNYNIQDVIQMTHVKGLDQEFHHRALIFGNEYQGASVYAALFVDPILRGQGQGSFMSRMRGLFVAEHSEFFSELIIANIRGYFDKNRVSDFWQAIGHHFFGLDFHSADYAHACRGSKFIADLAPKYPIYIELLPKAAQLRIGHSHETTEPARHVLEKEGFYYRGVVDVFDGGPIIEACKHNIKTVQETRKTLIEQIVDQLDVQNTMMICRLNSDFRAIIGKVQPTPEGGVRIEAKTAEILELSVGDPIRYSPFR